MWPFKPFSSFVLKLPIHIRAKLAKPNLAAPVDYLMSMGASRLSPDDILGKNGLAY